MTFAGRVDRQAPTEIALSGRRRVSYICVTSITFVTAPQSINGIDRPERDPPVGSFVCPGMKGRLCVWRSLWKRTAQSRHCDAIGLQMQPPKDAAPGLVCIWCLSLTPFPPPFSGADAWVIESSPVLPSSILIFFSPSKFQDSSYINERCTWKQVDGNAHMFSTHLYDLGLYSVSSQGNMLVALQTWSEMGWGRIVTLV